jgi:hypothetical protein
LPTEPVKHREVRSAASITKWIIAYIVAIMLVFGLSFAYFSSPDLFAWKGSSAAKPQSAASQTPSVTPTAPRVENTAAVLKNSFNQFSVFVQKATILLEDSKKVNIAGDSKGTAANYRSVQRGADALLAQLTVPPDSLPEIGAILMPLKESLSLLSKSTSIMADYLEGKLTLAPPNPDWVGRSQEYAAQSQARLKEAQQALVNLRKKLE